VHTIIIDNLSEFNHHCATMWSQFKKKEE